MRLFECSEGEEAGLCFLTLAREGFFEGEEVVGEVEVLLDEGAEGGFGGWDGGMLGGRV